MPLCYLVLSAVEGINEFSQNCQISISYAVWIKVHHVVTNSSHLIKFFEENLPTNPSR